MKFGHFDDNQKEYVTDPALWPRFRGRKPSHARSCEAQEAG